MGCGSAARPCRYSRPKSASDGAVAAFQPVMKLAELPPGSMRACLIGAREIVVCRSREGVFALDNICTHAHARLCEGRLRATRLTCPLHGATFDIRNGRPLSSPAEIPLLTHAVRVVEDSIEVEVSAAG
jgi:nitrite reductase/ring-hydroxylating ferredoxin subunit